MQVKKRYVLVMSIFLIIPCSSMQQPSKELWAADNYSWVVKSVLGIGMIAAMAIPVLYYWRSSFLKSPAPLSVPAVLPGASLYEQKINVLKNKITTVSSSLNPYHDFEIIRRRLRHLDELAAIFKEMSLSKLEMSEAIIKNVQDIARVMEGVATRLSSHKSSNLSSEFKKQAADAVRAIVKVLKSIEECGLDEETDTSLFIISLQEYTRAAFHAVDMMEREKIENDFTALLYNPLYEAPEKEFDLILPVIKQLQASFLIGRPEYSDKSRRTAEIQKWITALSTRLVSINSRLRFLEETVNANDTCGTMNLKNALSALRKKWNTFVKFEALNADSLKNIYKEVESVRWCYQIVMNSHKDKGLFEGIIAELRAYHEKVVPIVYDHLLSDGERDLAILDAFSQIVALLDYFPSLWKSIYKDKSTRTPQIHSLLLTLASTLNNLGELRGVSSFSREIIPYLSDKSDPTQRESFEKFKQWISNKKKNLK